MPFNEEDRDYWVSKACDMLDRAGIVIREDERASMEIADFKLSGDFFPTIGMEIVVYENNERYCAKELIMFPGQICPEHMHPSVDGQTGKQETFRCRWGEVYLHVPGEPTLDPKGMVPPGKESSFSIWHEIILRPGDQFTLVPETWHWFQGGPEGAIVSEFSSTSRDENDVFTDQEIWREKNTIG
ncbi:MAG TPA: D-lyxose/D-mannose family sugar isomerase [Candidatus Lokiarchaeia archaeon]|nr:D-lyxose/D-mannose family sugar isomerase [Candidatus Lokiarchaeia archaeon]